MKVELSVIVPVYNVEKYIGKCLDSLVNQTEKNIEIIIVNDGSTDNSQTIIDSYKSLHSNKIISLTKKNSGLADTRNYGLQYATGKYVCFLDSDDYVEVDAYSKLLKCSDNGEKNIVACGYYKEWHNRLKIIKDSEYGTIQDYLKDGLVVAWNKIYKREWLLSTGVLFPKGLLYEDVEFFCKLLYYVGNINNVAFVSEPLIHYVQRGDSISYSETTRINEIQIIISNVLSFYKEKGNCVNYDQELEFKFVKALLGSYFIKYLHLQDTSNKNNAIRNNWLYINKTFPNYKKNKYLRNNFTLSGLYIKLVNRSFYTILSKIPICYFK